MEDTKSPHKQNGLHVYNCTREMKLHFHETREKNNKQDGNVPSVTRAYEVGSGEYTASKCISPQMLYRSAM